MSWFKDWLKKLACKWLKKNKTEVVVMFGDFTDELFKRAKDKFYAKYPNLPPEVKKMVEEFVAQTDDEVDVLFADKIEELIKKLENGKSK